MDIEKINENTVSCVIEKKDFYEYGMTEKEYFEMIESMKNFQINDNILNKINEISIEVFNKAGIKRERESAVFTSISRISEESMELIFEKINSEEFLKQINSFGSPFLEEKKPTDHNHVSKNKKTENLKKNENINRDFNIFECDDLNLLINIIQKIPFKISCAQSDLYSYRKKYFLIFNEDVPISMSEYLSLSEEDSRIVKAKGKSILEKDAFNILKTI